MGLIRKTVSISTLGVVSFRSKKERLARAEAAFHKAESELDRQQAARLEADQRVADAERRARKAELFALHEAKAASAERGRRRKHRREVAAKVEAKVEEQLGTFVREAKPIAKRQAKHAKRQAKHAAARASDMVDTVKDQVKDRLPTS